jgi:hypothetical protein
MEKPLKQFFVSQETHTYGTENKTERQRCLAVASVIPIAGKNSLLYCEV